MLRQPWFNLGLWWGDGENVATMPRAFFETLTEADIERYMKDSNLRKAEVRRAWKALGRAGPVPEWMQIVIRREALEDMVDEITARMGIKKRGP
jgi:RecB family exonuclease